MKNHDEQVDIWLDSPIYKTINKVSDTTKVSETLNSAEETYEEIKESPDIDIEIYKASNLRYDDSEEYWNDYYNKSKQSINESFKVSNFQEFYTALKCANNNRSQRNNVKATPLKVKRFNS